MNFLPLSSPSSFHPRLTNQLFRTRAAPYPARATPSALWAGPEIPGYLQTPAARLARSLAPRPGMGRTGLRTKQATPRGGSPRLRRPGPPGGQPASSAGAPLTSWAWREAAARRGRGDAAGFRPGWDMARLLRVLPPGQRSGDWKGGPGGERWEERRESAQGRRARP